MPKKFYITTPIYYVNGVPHIGHTYTTVAADVLARWHRLIGDDVFFLTGTDEHGAKIEEKAKEMKLKPQKYVDEIADKFKQAWQELNISHNNFFRTTDKNHIKAVQKALQFMYDKGDIYLSKYEGLYCRGCEQYKKNRDLVDGLCPDHKTVPEKMSEECYTFKLSKYQDKLLELIKKDKLQILPLNRKNEIVSFYEKEGLEDISFSRKNVNWGIPIPWDNSHTIYVWADAFLYYLTGLGWDGFTPLIKQDRGINFWPPQVQLMSKDILRVHTTIWPAMLLSLGLPLSKTIFVHGYFSINGQKMSKSIGNVIVPNDLIKKYGVDATRYLIMSAAVFGSDGDISRQQFDEKYNADLANGLGNLVARVSNLLEKNNLELNLKINSNKKLIREYKEKMLGFKFDEVLKSLWQKLRTADEILSDKKPWKLEDKKEIKNILEPVAEDLLNVASLLKPFMPTVAEKIIKQFSVKQIKKSQSLFPRIN
ncbi:methionine--tRNA ligase [Patescibacteria group bacterium]|nr:methionine--tRNA ligase [Patescibacteria group bacterium]MBU1663474.1 methionine--tRNA ligase [Patescibacteria group bacterium]MBU1933719.1 methionine--tRNA ligase [Patescibacteria group bacterium]MBU2007665.1 methionine--tRNA ligase [Patescibacteria group bacterium]MBU2233317.1 methionine--tRNA ligase [Patescibacteria group bacterium]